MKKVWGIVIFLAVLLLFGTVGAIECDTISMGRGIVQCAVALVVGAVGYFKLNKEERR